MKVAYESSQLPAFIKLCERQRAKDEQLIDEVVPYLRSGASLEIGAGCGQISEILASHGISIVASDIEDFFLEYHEQRGLKSARVDAMNIVKSTGERYNNIVTQGVTTLVTNKLEWVRATYQSIWDALEPSGRLIFVFPNAYPSSRQPWSTIADHQPIIESIGFEFVTKFRHQLFPASFYRRISPMLTKGFERTLGRRLGVRHVLVLERPRLVASAA